MDTFVRLRIVEIDATTLAGSAQPGAEVRCCSSTRPDRSGPGPKFGPEALAEGLVLWEVKTPTARQAWAEIKPTIEHIAGVVTAQEAVHAL